MEECLSDYNMEVCATYLDDIIFLDSLEEHLNRLDMVLKRLKECNMKLNPKKKCKLLQTKVKYVDHIVSENGAEPDPEKLDKVKNWSKPKNAEEIRQFTSFAGYYRRFVNDF